ncbi:MAG: PfkB family carbohydrate kinase [Thermoguttaceae bacterium]|jgi:1-phosphofructokinase family hexose kinase
MILSAGLTPAWQQTLVFDRFRPGEVNRARESHWCASGKVLNAAVAAHRLGGPVLALAAAGGPPLAEMDHDLAELGLQRRWVVTQAATRVCTTILDHGAGRMTELVTSAPPLTAAELDAFAAAYAEEAARADAVVLIGSLPAEAPAATYRRLVEKTPCPAVLDFRGEGLLGLLDLKPCLVKPNREELAQTLGRDLDDDAALLAAMHDLNRRGAQWVLVTQGPGPVWLTAADRAYRLHPPPLGQVVNPLGSGDAMAAAAALAIARGAEMVEAARLGIAAAQANLRQLLPGRLDPAGIETAAGQVRVETL